MAKRKTLDRWIHEAIADTDKDQALSTIVLYHMRGMQPIELFTWKPNSSHGADPKALAELFHDKAATYSQDLEGVQTFNLCAFYGKPTPEAQMPFVVRVEADIHATGLSTEAPTDTGRVQQTMRWAEMQQGQVYRRQQIMDDHSIRMIEQQSRMIESLMADRFNAANVVVEMMMKQAENSHKLELERLSFERSSNMQASLLKLGPALVNSITGTNVFPQSTADSALIETIANSLDETHLPKLMELQLPDTIMGPLVTRIAQAREKKETEEQAKKRPLTVYKGKPEDDVTGGGE